MLQHYRASVRLRPPPEKPSVGTSILNHILGIHDALSTQNPLSVHNWLPSLGPACSEVTRGNAPASGPPGEYAGGHAAGSGADVGYGEAPVIYSGHTTPSHDWAGGATPGHVAHAPDAYAAGAHAGGAEAWHDPGGHAAHAAEGAGYEYGHAGFDHSVGVQHYEEHAPAQYYDGGGGAGQQVQSFSHSGEH